MPRHPVRIGNLEFNSKTESEDYTRTFLLNTLGSSSFRSIYAMDSEYIFLSNLTKRKPSRFIISRGASGGCDLDAVDRVGWRKLAKCIEKHKSPADRLTHAMRNAIIKGKPNYVDSECAICGRQSGDIQADHVIPFDSIKKEYISSTDQNGANTPTAFVDWYDGSDAFENLEDPWVLSWIEYHDSRVEWQPLCAPCNVAKSNHTLH